ncbi:hypothetical protein F4824DRAFT_500029 [Ustulina deusta]|nr:hypothetical protein F4824DRAFT_500029 [Ustulina deusta]
MKPVVGAMQAWSCVVISCFAIIILSIIGSLYRSKHHEFVGGVDDPDNTSEVSSTIFTAVIVYARKMISVLLRSRECDIRERPTANVCTSITGFPSVLRSAGRLAYARESTWRYRTMISEHAIRFETMYW